MNVDRRHRMPLTLLLSGVFFIVTLITLFLIGVALYFADKMGFLTYFERNPTVFSFFLPLAAFSLIGGTLLTLLLARIPLAPVNKIINAMDQLASGNFHTRLAFDGILKDYPTVRELTDSFNTMAAELEGTELLRSDFINNFSHEFKTPIVSIAGFAGLLKQGKMTPAEQEEYLTIIENESRRLACMATNVLNMTKVENQTILTNTTTYNLSEQLRSCILLLEPKWEQKHLDMIVDFPEHFICANEEMLTLVWVNLIENAIKFAPEYGTVQVSLTQQGGSFTVTVFNTGSYIPPEQQQSIFRRFYQADGSHSTEGHGIGLAIVKRVVSLHSGSIRVDSNPDGTAFHVLLPKNQ